ncbi:MAG: peroxiredoxin [Verrucomicrobiales bacterium]
MVQLQAKITDFESAGVQVVGISYDSTEILKKFAAKQKITFPLLSDPESKVINAFHIVNEKAPSKWNGIPHPGTFIIDQKGTIRSKFFLESYRKRHPASVILDAAKAVKS